MRNFSFARFIMLPAVICIALAVFVGCGSSGTPATAPATPAKVVSSFELAKAFETDAVKATADYASQTLKIVDLLAEGFWDMDTEKYLKCAPYNSAENNGNMGSDSYLGAKKINNVVVAYPFQFNIDDQKTLEGLTLTKQETVDGVIKTIYTDMVEIECELNYFKDDVLSFKNPKIIKK